MSGCCIQICSTSRDPFPITLCSSVSLTVLKCVKERRNPQRLLWFNGATGSNLKFMILGLKTSWTPTCWTLEPSRADSCSALQQTRSHRSPKPRSHQTPCRVFDSLKVITRLPCGFTGAGPGPDHTFAPAVRHSDSFPTETKTEAGGGCRTAGMGGDAAA